MVRCLPTRLQVVPCEGGNRNCSHTIPNCVSNGDNKHHEYVNELQCLLGKNILFKSAKN